MCPTDRGSAPLLSSELAQSEVEKIFSERLAHDPASKTRIRSRESSTLEFKQAFNWNSRAKYAKTIGAFANSQGGFLVFGVRNRPHEVIDVDTEAFEDVDPAEISGFLNQFLAPEVTWWRFTMTFATKAIAVIAVAQCPNRPVLCTRNKAPLREGAIYYRYSGRTSEIKYSELEHILAERERTERDKWLAHLSKMARVGVENVAVLDLLSGELSGSGGKLLISEELLSKVRFIRKGHFSDGPSALPALKVLGDVEVVPNSSIAPTRVVKKPTAINELEIMLTFLRQQKPAEPLEFLRAACNETTGFLPIYYYATLAELSLHSLRQVIEAVPLHKPGKRIILDRLDGKRPLAPVGSLKTGQTAEQRSDLVEALCRGEYEAIREAKRRRLLEAFTHLQSEELTPRALRSLADILEGEFGDWESSYRTLARKTVALLDESLFKEQVRRTGGV